MSLLQFGLNNVVNTKTTSRRKYSHKMSLILFACVSKSVACILLLCCQETNMERGDNVSVLCKQKVTQPRGSCLFFYTKNCFKSSVYATLQNCKLHICHGVTDFLFCFV